MDDAAHIALAEALHRVQGMVMLSGYDSPLYDRLFANWRRLERLHHADGAVERLEVLWLCPKAAAALDRSETQACLFEGEKL